MMRLQDKNTSFNMFISYRFHDEKENMEFPVVLFRCFTCTHIELFDPESDDEFYGIQQKDKSVGD